MIRASDSLSDLWPVNKCFTYLLPYRVSIPSTDTECRQVLVSVYRYRVSIPCTDIDCRPSIGISFDIEYRYQVHTDIECRQVLVSGISSIDIKYRYRMMILLIDIENRSIPSEYRHSISVLAEYRYRMPINVIDIEYRHNIVVGYIGIGLLGLIQSVILLAYICKLKNLHNS